MRNAAIGIRATAIACVLVLGPPWIASLAALCMAALVLFAGSSLLWAVTVDPSSDLRFSDAIQISPATSLGS